MIDARIAIHDYAQIVNLLNGDTCRMSEDTPIANRLLEFFQEQARVSRLLPRTVGELWNDFNDGRGRLP